MPITIRDLAEKLKLSITTVSRALDNYDDVAEETRIKVIEAAHEMGYEPSFAARQLRRKRTDAIGYILPTTSPSFTDPFYINFLTGLCDEVSTHQIDLLITSCEPESEKERNQYRQWVQSRQIDGIVINRTRISDWRVEYLFQNKIPFVSLGKGITTADYPHINIDDTNGVRSLVKHLFQKGHQNIAFIGTTPELVVHADRYEGYLQGLRESNIAINPQLVVQGDLSEAGGYLAAKTLLSLPTPPTAILGCNDLTAFGVLRAAKEKGLYIGTELAVAGYDGIKETEFTNPPLTTLFQPTYEIARQLAKMLVMQIEGIPIEQKTITIEPKLLIRASTG